MSSTPRTTDAGWIASTGIIEAAQFAVATKNTLAAIEIASMQNDIAKGYLALAQELRDYWNSTFRPAEQALMAEARAAKLYEPQYAVTAGRYVASIRQQFRKKAEDVMRAVPRYCTGLTAGMTKDMALAEAVALGSAMNYAYRYEEARKEAKDDLRWNRLKGALDMGRNLQSESAKYSQLAGNMYNSLGQQAAAGATGALQALGRDDTRFSTEQQRAMQLGRSGPVGGLPSPVADAAAYGEGRSGSVNNPSAYTAPSESHSGTNMIEAGTSTSFPATYSLVQNEVGQNNSGDR